MMTRSRNDGGRPDLTMRRAPRLSKRGPKFALVIHFFYTFYMIFCIKYGNISIVGLSSAVEFVSLNFAQAGESTAADAAMVAEVPWYESYRVI